MENNYVLTQEGKEKLEQELHFLETEKRAEIGDRIRVAREFGDISENSEYDDAKNEQAANEVRIAETLVSSVRQPSWRLPPNLVALTSAAA